MHITHNNIISSDYYYWTVVFPDYSGRNLQKQLKLFSNKFIIFPKIKKITEKKWKIPQYQNYYTLAGSQIGQLVGRYFVKSKRWSAIIGHWWRWRWILHQILLLLLHHLSILLLESLRSWRVIEWLKNSLNSKQKKFSILPKKLFQKCKFFQKKSWYVKNLEIFRFKLIQWKIFFCSIKTFQHKTLKKFKFFPQIFQ